ncbi:MAG: 4-(cytidine 5'-diphospho)-2-C-methyl-D-erythritol kinase, partial [Gemmatimonadetes bacterium HGW-Gemmatimonadetes-1]
MNQAITVSCPAKVNLFLRVLAREADGYHGLETLFCRIGLADELTVERTDDGIELEVSGADVGPVEQNLAWRAADAVLAATGRRFGVRMQMIKRIPAGGGLG